ELEKLYQIYQQEKDLGRTIAYRRAISILQGHKQQIQSKEDIKKIKGIGDKIKLKIQEILQNGTCEKIQNLINDEKNISINILSKVWGIGTNTAHILYKKGIKTIEQLKQNQHLLNKNQKIGLKYYDELNKRMHREEATKIIQKVQEQIKILYPKQYDKYNIIACGSYRREKETCGDVDILICRNDFEQYKHKNLMITIIQQLHKCGLLTDDLALPKNSRQGVENYMGVCQLSSDQLHRRIDIKYYPNFIYGFALIYFTGSDYFNRSMRLFARKKGFSLSDNGLFPVQRCPNKVKVVSGETICCYTEKDVFDALHLKYQEPKMRNL
ncbi:DNA-directed polymerase lambda, putative, partial [Ichthyophthirius multifiliis]